MKKEIEMKKSARSLRVSHQAYKLQASSWPEVREAFTFALGKIAHHVPDFSGSGEMRNSVQPGPLLNCIVIWFLTLPRKKQVAIVRAGRKGINYLMHREYDEKASDVFTFDMNEIRAAWDEHHGMQPSLRIGGDDATRQHAITNDDNKERFELKGETGIDAERKPVYKKGRSVTQKVRQPRRKGIA